MSEGPGEHVVIPLADGHELLIDRADLPRLGSHRWRAWSPDQGRTWYAVTGGGLTRRYLHRVLLPTAFRVDHANHNGLDNRRANLRPCTASQNGGNSIPRPGSSRFKGVSWDKARRRWAAKIKVNRAQIHLGRCADERDAAAAYDVAAKRHFGEFALLNLEAA